MRVWMEENLRHQLRFLERELVGKATDALSAGESEATVIAAVQGHLIQWLATHGSEISLASISNNIIQKARTENDDRRQGG